ncbi:MAG: hypothetical protein ACRDOA_11425 [Streptosporangiaceae bacterium]
MLSTAHVAAMAQTSQDTVEREIERGNLAADKVGRTWVIEAAEAERWAAQFRPYAGLRKHPDGQDDVTGPARPAKQKLEEWPDDQ